jgi:hypothetical protein
MAAPEKRRTDNPAAALFAAVDANKRVTDAAREAAATAQAEREAESTEERGNSGERV